MLVSLFLCLCQEQGAWRGEQTPHTNDTLTLTHMTLIDNIQKHSESQAPPTETEDMLTSPNVKTSDKGLGDSLENLEVFSEIDSTLSQQADLEKPTFTPQSLSSTKPTNTPSVKSPDQHLHTPTHAPSNAEDHRLDSRSTHDTLTPITVKPCLERTEPLAASASLVSTDADSESHPTDSHFTHQLTHLLTSNCSKSESVLHFICTFLFACSKEKYFCVLH